MLLNCCVILYCLCPRHIAIISLEYVHRRGPYSISGWSTRVRIPCYMVWCKITCVQRRRICNWSFDVSCLSIEHEKGNCIIMIIGVVSVLWYSAACRMQMLESILRSNCSIMIRWFVLLAKTVGNIFMCCCGSRELRRHHVCCTWLCTDAGMTVAVCLFHNLHKYSGLQEITSLRSISCETRDFMQFYRSLSTHAPGLFHAHGISEFKRFTYYIVI